LKRRRSEVLMRKRENKWLKGNSRREKGPLSEGIARRLYNGSGGRCIQNRKGYKRPPACRIQDNDSVEEG